MYIHIGSIFCVIIAAEILLSPQSLTVFVGENATFDCVGSEEITRYQWKAYDNDNNLIDTTNINISKDQLFSSQTYMNVQLNDIHMIQCVLISNETSINSDKVTLKVVRKYHHT